MPVYGVQSWWNCEEHGITSDQQTFRESDDPAAILAFRRRADSIRDSARERDGPKLIHKIQLFRLNEAGDKGELLASIPVK